MPFYVADWVKDPGLRLCTKAAKGLWIDLLCVLWEAEERGVASTGGVPWSDQQVAAVVGGDTSETSRLLAELFANGVCSRNKSGAILSRRMVRDEDARTYERSRKRKQRKRKQPSSCPGDVPCDVPALSPYMKYDSEISKTHIDSLYEAYPRKIQRPRAIKAIRKALGEAPFDVLIAAVQAYAKSVAAKDRKYIPYPASWFNDRRWEDDRTEWGETGDVIPDEWWSDWHEEAGKRIAKMTSQEKNQWKIPVGLPEPKVIKPQ